MRVLPTRLSPEASPTIDRVQIQIVRQTPCIATALSKMAQLPL